MSGAFAALFIVTVMTVAAPQAEAASRKVVIVVGPVGSSTADYKRGANRLAKQAASYGARVVKLYSPYATWARVRTAAKGANLLIYLGHGNGWPSPYHPFEATNKDGMGLNASAGHGNSNTKYYGETYMAKLALAPHAVVVLNRLCYASGNNEWGAGNPTQADRDQARRQLRGRLPPGGRPGRVRRAASPTSRTCSRACSRARRP